MNWSPLLVLGVPRADLEKFGTLSFCEAAKVMIQIFYDKSFLIEDIYPSLAIKSIKKQD